MTYLHSRNVRHVALVVAGALAIATVVQPSRASAGDYSGAIAGGIIGGAMLAIIASQAAQANQNAAAAQQRRVKRTKSVKAPAAPKAEAQAQIVQQTPPPMNSDPFKGVAPAAVPSSSASPASF